MPELVVLGNLLVDDVVYADGTTRMGQPGGAVLYFALAARLFGLEVGIVSWRGDDYPQAMLDTLAGRGIALAGIHELGGPGLRTWLLYEGRLRRVVHRLGGPTHADVSPRTEHIPAAWRDARAFHLAPMPVAIQRDLVADLGKSGGSLLSLDPYELLSEDNLDEWRRLLPGLDVFFLSEDEMLIDRAPEAELTRLAGGRLRQVVFKQGRGGGLLHETGEDRSSRLLPWKPRASKVVDPTGAGDAFAAGFLAGRLFEEPAERALERGVVAASFALEGAGVDGLVNASPETARHRLRAWYGRS